MWDLFNVWYSMIYSSITSLHAQWTITNLHSTYLITFLCHQLLLFTSTLLEMTIGINKTSFSQKHILLVIMVTWSSNMFVFNILFWGSIWIFIDAFFWCRNLLVCECALEHIFCYSNFFGLKFKLININNWLM